MSALVFWMEQNGVLCLVPGLRVLVGLVGVLVLDGFVFYEH